jgi:hypothetical protein
MNRRWKLVLGGGGAVATLLLGAALVRPQAATAAPVVTVYASPT